MDNEAPKYATWIPEAEGYVANGKVVSKSPMYDASGKLKLDVDASLFNGTQQPVDQGRGTAAQQDVALASNPLNTGVTTLNATNSGTDANAQTTGIGSLGSVSTNTATTGGVLTSPATQSNIAQTPKSVYDQLQEKFAVYQANNNYKGMIDTLTEMSKYDGQDYSGLINQYTDQRNNKIKTIDDQYNANRAQALMAGNNDLAEQIYNEQTAWRNSVGYQQAMQDKHDREIEDVDIKYKRLYWDGINTITNSIMQLTDTYINFQYNPYQDTALQMAQGYATSKVKEQMNSTGMFYSTMTTNAITKAVAELVPVYEKMAKEEIKENLQMLQTTAAYLIDLEQTEFNMWKSQIELQWEKNAEERAQIKAAWERVDQIGYVDNAASAILGIEAGTLSPSAREHLQTLQETKDAEERALKQKKDLADYTSEITMSEHKEKAEIDNKYALDRLAEQNRYEIEQMREQNRLNKDYYKYQVDNPKSSSSDGADTKLGGSYNTKELVEYYNTLEKSGEYTDEEISQKLYNAAKTTEDYDQAINKINSGDTNTNSTTVDQEVKYLNNMASTSKPSTILKEAIKYSSGNGDTLARVLSGVNYAKDDDSLLSNKPMFNVETLANMGVRAYETYLDYYKENDGNAKDLVKNSNKFITSLDNEVKSKAVTEDEYNNALITFNDEIVQDIVKSTAKKYGEDATKTNKAIKDVVSNIETYSDNIGSSLANNKAGIIADAYIKLIDSIVNADTTTFDYNKLPFNQGIKSKTEAVANIASSVRDSKLYGENTSLSSVYDTVLDYTDALAAVGSINKLNTAWGAGY